MTVTVSVILPTFNRSHSLPAAMMSVLTQSMGDLEVIVVDDASTEDIEGLVRRIGDDRVRYVRRAANGGAGAARNTGLAEARGEYVAFQDSDDLWLPDKIEKQLALFAKLPADVGAVTGAKILYGRDNDLNYADGKVSIMPAAQRWLKLEEDQVVKLLDENRISLQNTLFRKDCMPEIAWFDPCARANSDWEFAVRLSQHVRIYEDKDPVVLGFVSNDSISRSPRKKVIGVLRILKNNRAVLATHKRQKSELMRDVARSLYKTKKPRWAMRILLGSIADYPPSAFFVIETLWRRLGGSLALARRRMGLAPR